MKLLLDTHALLWWLADDPQLGPKARNAIADPANEVLISVVSLWEIAIKARIGKLKADVTQVAEATERSRMLRLPIADAHLKALASLQTHHHDPFDHLLIAQAVAEAATFITSDRHAPLYAIQTQPASA